MVRVFLAALAVLLLGYMFMGRGFAHVGRSPVFVGEVVLALGLLGTSFALIRLRLRPAGSPVLYLLLGFMALGLARTVPYIGQYGMDALRDGVLWGYGLFAVIVYLVVDRATLLRGIRGYGRVVPVFALWLPLCLNVAGGLSGTVDPATPGSSVPLVVFKNGDMAVHVAGSLAYLVLVAPAAAGLWLVAARTIVALPLAWTAYLTATISRGALLTSLAGIALIALLRPRTRNWMPVLLGTLVLVILLAPGAIRDLQGCNVSGDPSKQQASDREVSACQLIQNSGSIIGGSEAEGLQGTKSFRMRWWTAIFDYTVRGPWFWTGKGFGVNLADDDGFQVNPDHSLRAPHNSHMTALARMGVPGFVLWALLQGVFAIALLRAFLTNRRAGERDLAAAAGWLLVYWLAMMVNTSFDPYLEGPQGGIWLWVVFGLGMVVMRETPRGAKS